MKRVIIAMLVVAAAVSCRKSELQVEENGKISLSTAVAGFDEHFPQRPAETQNRAASKANSASKADATDFPVGQTLGLYLHTDNPIGAAARCHSQNIEYATPDGGTTWNQRASLDAPINDGTTYYATAYSPFVEGAFEPTAMALAVATDQSIGDALERSDLRIARNTPISGSGSTFTATLDFTHALAMFELKLLIPQMVEGREVDQIETIVFENMATKGTINLATGAITTDLNSVASVKPRIVSGTGLIGVMTTYQAIVVPQNVDGNVLLAKIRCRMKDGSTETMDYVTPSRGWISFRSGVKTSITLMPTAEAAFMGDLPELMDGQAHTDLALPIFVETGLRWTIDAPGCDWLTLSDAAGGTYGEKLSGTSATGAWQNIFVKVSANTSQTMPRTGDLLLRAWRADGSEVPAAVLRLVQNYYTFSPVGGTWNTSADAASDPVQPFASNQQWTAESDAAWLLLATSANPGSGNPTRKFTHVGALEADKLFVQVLANNSAAARRGVVTISSPVVGAAPMKIYVNQMGNQPYIEINGLRWATGNLVATRSSVDGVSAPGCMIGAPDDGGLYFQFGSLIGYKGGAIDYQGTGNKLPDASMIGKVWNGTGFTWASDTQVWPSEMTSNPSAWPNNNGSTAGDRTTVVDQWFFNFNTAPYSTGGQDIRDFSSSFTGDKGSGNLGTGRYAKWGIGDPCTYYLGDTWRLPTTNEFVSLCNNQGGGNWVPWATVGSSWTTSPTYGGNFASNQLFFPASGGRNGSNGSFINVTVTGYYWSSSVYNATAGCYLLFYQPNGVIPQGYNTRSNGFPVRCVQPVPTVPNPPAESDYVEINGLYWAKGNLVATNNTNAKVGKPEDGGLYFQFGSLIGYKGGNLASGGTGVGIPDGPMQNNGAFWNGASAWSWGNDVGLWPDKLEGQPTAWPTNTTNQWYFGLQSGWSTAGQNIRDYSGFTAGNLADKGIGDPCTYYLGHPWRLPTSTEYGVLFGNVDNSTIWSSVPNWSWSTTTKGAVRTGNTLYFPASGYREGSNGSIYNASISGYGRSSAIYSATDGLRLGFNDNNVAPQYNFSRPTAYTVRCVANPPHKPTPPAADEAVEINGLKWATGNLVASGPHNAKVGKPADYGIYFQFGSLIGWTGGANGNGVGQGSPALDKVVWPEVMGPTKPNFAWQSADAVNVSSLNNYYFNYSAAPWETVEQNIRDFAVPIAGDAGSGSLASGRYAKQGVGDPCTYYLGGAWRLPTSGEYKALCNNQGGYNAIIAWGGACGASWASSPVNGGNFASNQLFFPASGFRNHLVGSFSSVTVSGHSWSSSAYNATNGLYLTFNQSNGVLPQNYSVRSLGFPVRCVSGMNVNPMDDWAAGPASESRTITISGISGSWSAAKSGTDAATLQLSSSSGPNEGTLTLTWPANSSTTVRSASITITAGAQSYTFATRQYGTNAIKVNGMIVAKGNLVADGQNSCKVGAPTDGGLYFQFGSLIGYKGGNQANGGTGVGMPQAPLTNDKTYWDGSAYSWASDAMVWPSELVGTKTSWANTTGAGISTLSDYYFNYSVAPWETTSQNIRDFAVSISGDKGSGTLGTGRYAKQGVGDPCTYYIGDAWRLPTGAEYATLCNNKTAISTNYSWSDVGASWVTAPVVGGNFASNQLFFPASGYRYTSNGSFANVKTASLYWSSSIHNTAYSLNFNFTSSWVRPQHSGGRSAGFPVRCVGI